MVTVTTGDCLEVMAAMESNTVDAIVTDPPYGLAFMGKAWDHGVPGEPFWREALRVAKPGTHLVAFGGTRTHHRLMVAIEDAGWEVRDCLMWLYGSGFPKSHDISKAIDRAAGAERDVVGLVDTRGLHDGATRTPSNRYTGAIYNGGNEGGSSIRNITAPATDLARQWDGWGTALKPAWEPIVLARKPLAGTVAANVARYGVGGLNVDGCRIPGPPVSSGGATGWAGAQGGLKAVRSEGHHAGRWPANVVLDEDAAARLDAEVGDLGQTSKPGAVVRKQSAATERGNTGAAYGKESRPFGEIVLAYGDSGGPSRFYYTAKASRSEREAGLTGERANGHPTVKPIALMRWLCRLVTPPGGLVLDPFTGSGSTGCAAVLEGFRFHGVELSEEYAAIARQRITYWRCLTPAQLGMEFPP